MSPVWTSRRIGCSLAVVGLCASAAVVPASAQALNPQPEPPGIVAVSINPLATITVDLQRGPLLSVVLLPPGPCIDLCETPRGR